MRGDSHLTAHNRLLATYSDTLLGYHVRGLQCARSHLLPSYLCGIVYLTDELEWRFNNRENPYLFRDTLLKLIKAENLPYQELVH